MWHKQLDKAVGVVSKASTYYATAKTLWHAGKFLATTVGPMLV